MRALKPKLKTAARSAAPRAGLPADILATLELVRAQAIAHVVKLDESDAAAWAKIIGLVRQVGLTKQTLCRELSCAWSTILRWEAGQTVPGPFARKAIKDRLVELLAEKPQKLTAADTARRGRVRVVRSAATA